MSQFQNPYAQVDPMTSSDGPRKTSGLAITSLVFSLIGLIPCCGVLFAPIGLLLGLIGTVILGPTAARKGRGMSIASVIIGLILTAGQGGLMWWGFNAFYRPVMDGPRFALEAAERGDVAGFKAAFGGGGATASDEEAQAFIDEMHTRYGAYVSVKLDEDDQSMRQPRFGQPEAPFPYEITFANDTRSAVSVILFADQRTGEWVMKPSELVITDSVDGDLSYPPNGASSRSTTPAKVVPEAPSSDAADPNGGEATDEPNAQP